MRLAESMRLAVLETPPPHPRDWLDWLGRREAGTLSLCESNLYIVQCNGEAGPIKIGMARDVAKRIAQFRIANPYPLTCLAQHQAPYEAERLIHARFSHAALGGEWFAAVPELVEFATQIGIEGPRFCR